MKRLKRMVPVSQKERSEIATRLRARALLEEHSNRVGEIIFAKTRKAPNMRLIEGLPKSMAELEEHLQVLRDYRVRAAKNEGFKKHGPKFITLYDLVAKSIGYRFGTEPTKQMLNKQYFPTPKIKILIAELKRSILVDSSVDAKTRSNVAASLKRLGQRTNVKQFLFSMIEDRVILSKEIGAEVLTTKSDADDFIERLTKIKGRLPSGKFNPIQQAELYVELYVN